MTKAKVQSLTRLAQAAFRMTAARVIQRAKQTNTPVIVWEDGCVKAVPAEIMETRLKGLSRKRGKR
jgi:hypothetical protein